MKPSTVVVMVAMFATAGVAMQNSRITVNNDGSMKQNSDRPEKKSDVPLDVFEEMQQRGSVTREGAKKFLSDEEFSSYDLNEDGAISREEWDKVTLELEKDSDSPPEIPTADEEEDEEEEHSEESPAGRLRTVQITGAGQVEKESDSVPEVPIADKDDQEDEEEEHSEESPAGRLRTVQIPGSGQVEKDSDSSPELPIVDKDEQEDEDEEEGEEFRTGRDRTVQDTGSEAETRRPTSLVATYTRMRVVKRINATMEEYYDGEEHTDHKEILNYTNTVSLCNKNKYYSAGLCYKHCKDTHRHAFVTMCQGDCNDGYSPFALTCHGNRRRWWKSFKTHWRPRYDRGVGTIPPLISLRDSQGPNIPNEDATNFALAVVADPQFGYYGDLVDENREIVESVDHFQQNGISWPTMAGSGHTSASNIKGVVMPGDLTNTADQAQWYDFKKVWGENDNPREINYKGKLWPMLGNHDYQNYIGYRKADGNMESKWYALGEATWTFYGADGAAQHSLGWMRAVAGGNQNSVYPNWGGADHYDKGSASYAWSIGKFRFLALQNYPTYKATCQQVGHHDESGNPADCGPLLSGLDSPMEFMKRDLAAACALNQWAVLFFHDYGDRFCSKWRTEDWRKQECKTFLEAIKDTCVVAVVVGHLHDKIGDWGSDWINELDGVTAKNKWGQDPKLLFSGAPSGKQGLWLMMKFDEANCVFGWTSMKHKLKHKETDKWYANKLALPDCNN